MNMTELKPGSRLRSSVCTTELVVVRSPSSPVALTIGGVPPFVAGTEPAAGELDPKFVGETLVGKRYASADGTVEVLCAKSGVGVVAVNGEPLGLKGAKPLPASD